MFTRLAFVNKRTPDKQIIGEENYWVCKVDNNNNLIEGNAEGGINLIAKQFAYDWDTRVRTKNWFSDQQNVSGLNTLSPDFSK